MEAAIRTEKLKEIKNKQPPCGTKDISYRNKTTTMKVYEIPLDCLIFNQYNGRIATFVKTYEKEHAGIDANTDGGTKLIEEFLWESKKDRNKATQEDIREKGQLEYGIVTADGVVIDGNRRFMMLRRNAKEKDNPTAYFKGVILEDTLDSNPREIMRLETTYQMGVDPIVDYNPIQKYLKCRDLKGKGFNENEIAKMMREKASDIKTYLDILNLMDEYLKKSGYDGMYRILEIQKLEGHFVDLNNYVSRYKSGRKVQDMNWAPTSPDIDDLKNIYFDHMRAGFGVHDIRIIANPAEDKGFFTQESIWESFANEHFEKIEKVKDDETPLDRMRRDNPNANVIDIISSRDKDFEDKIRKILEDKLDDASDELKEQKLQNAPLKLLNRALNTLQKIDPEVEGFNCEEVKEASHAIGKIVENFIKIVDGKG